MFNNVIITKGLLSRITRILLIVVIITSLFANHVQPTSAKALLDPFTTCSAQSQIPTTECNALVALYVGTNGAAWHVNTNWLQTNTPCSWAGVTCVSGRVVSLTLGNNNLSGSIVTEIGNLTRLQSLLLGGNHLTGAIPLSLINLIQLTTLTVGCDVTATNPTLILFLVSLLGVSWNQDCPDEPANDDISVAKTINSLPFTDTQNTTDASLALDDPAALGLLSCAPGGTGTNTVWYAYTAATAGTLTLDTFGSNYNTILAAWTGSRVSLTEVQCNDDSSGTPQSQIAFQVSPGVTYYIEVAGKSASGTLIFNASFTATPTATATSVPPTATATAVPPTATATSIPPTATFTATAVPPTATETQVPSTATATSIPPTATFTATAVPPTATETEVPPTATATSIPPTATETELPAPLGPTPTSTFIPATATATHTELPPTATSIPATATEATQSATSTVTSAPTATSTPVTAVPTETAQASTATPTSTSIPATATSTPAVTATSTAVLLTKTFFSQKKWDGWLLESSESSGKGGWVNKGSKFFNIGDDANNRQYLGILSFKTAPLPDNAVITGVTLHFKQSTNTGASAKSLQGFMIDIKTGYLGKTFLSRSDFSSFINQSYGPFKVLPSNSWYSINLPGAVNYVNKRSALSGMTEFRLRFTIDDNNNKIANILQIFSGNAPRNSRPYLTVQYYIPPVGR